MPMPATCFRALRRASVLPALLAVIALAVPAYAGVQFKDALDDSPLNLAPIKGETITDAVKQFYETGKDPYVGNADAISTGKTLFNDNCQVCHGADADGAMCPSLVGDEHVNTRAGTDVGKFEIIHSGAAGAMKAFSKRGITQDQILKIIAYIHTLADQHKK